MLIRFFKENDLIGCGGDHQPIRLQVETLSQSDYRCVQGVARAGVARTGVARAGVARAGVVGTPNQSLEPIRVVRAGVVGTLNQSV